MIFSVSTEVYTMPGFAAHYLFGVSTFHHVKDRVIHSIIKQHYHAYSLGLQGPDLFFYYLPGFRKHPSPGSIAHNIRTGDFLNALIESSRLFTRQEEREIALCYAAGFLGHYTLDTTCHPYIYAKTRYVESTPDYFGRHVYLETDIDKKMLKDKKNLLPSGFHQERTIRLNRTERRVIARCLHYAYTRVFPELHLTYPDMYAATLSMPFGVFVLHDPYGKKKVFARSIEKFFPGYPYVSPLIPSDKLHFTRDPLNKMHKTWKNPWDTSITSTDSFYDLFEKAQEKYLRRLKLLSAFAGADTPSERQQDYLQQLTDDLGNCSYGSGLPL